MSASGTPRLALLALAVLSLIWGYNWVVMKQVIQYVDPFDFSAIRTVFGAATLFLVLAVLRKPMSLVAARQVILLGVLPIEMGADAVDIGKTIHPHPTLGESIGMAAEVAHGSCTDVPPARK